MAHDIFISYSHKDKVTADAICAALEGRGMRCWYAPRDIRPGDRWAGAIIEAIPASRIMVLVFTDFSNVSRQVLREVDNAVSSGVIILPFRLTDSAPSGEMKYYLATVHWLDAMNKPLKSAIDQLCDNAEAILHPSAKPTEEAEPAPAPAPAPESAPKKKKTGLIVGIAAGAAALIFAAALLLLPGKDREAPAETPDTPVVTEVPAEAAPEPATESAEASAGNKKPTPTPSAEDSPGVENYLYSVKGEKVQLDVYFGEGETVLTVPAWIEGKPVAWIGDSCFAENKTIEQVILPDTIEKIEHNAFVGCRNLKEINWPDSLKIIGGWAFAHTGFEEVTLPESLTTLSYGAFNGCIHLRKVTLPSGVNNIGVDTFASCPLLDNVVIPNPDVKIHMEAFDRDRKTTITGVAGSNAETFCKGSSLIFEEYRP